MLTLKGNVSLFGLGNSRNWWELITGNCHLNIWNLNHAIIALVHVHSKVVDLLLCEDTHLEDMELEVSSHDFAFKHAWATVQDCSDRLSSLFLKLGSDSFQSLSRRLRVILSHTLLIEQAIELGLLDFRPSELSSEELMQGLYFLIIHLELEHLLHGCGKLLGAHHHVVVLVILFE